MHGLDSGGCGHDLFDCLFFPKGIDDPLQGSHSIGGGDADLPGLPGPARFVGFYAQSDRLSQGGVLVSRRTGSLQMHHLAEELGKDLSFPWPFAYGGNALAVQLPDLPFVDIRGDDEE